jgi:hypothetical protein
VSGVLLTSIYQPLFAERAVTRATVAEVQRQALAEEQSEPSQQKSSAAESAAAADSLAAEH